MKIEEMDKAKKTSVGSKAKAKIKGYVVAVLENVKTGKKRVFKSKNIVCTTGEIYYAERGAGASPTNAFGIFELGTAGNAPAAGSTRVDVTSKVASSQKAHDSTYPKANDGDSDNTGAGVDVTSYRVSYTTGEANSAGINRVIITNASPGASEPLLMYAEFTAFTKTSADTLKMFVNHQFADDGV